MTNEKLEKENDRKFAVISGLSSAFIGALCCFSPLIIFLIGLSGAAAAGSLADELYINYKWYFRLAGLVFLLLTIFFWYKRKTQNCSLDKKKQAQRKALNLVFIGTFTYIIGYLIWNYVILVLIGEYFGLW